jgi:SAM-dependent methyltransferase
MTITNPVMANEFPDIWFDTFLTPDSAAPVRRELEFIQSYLPVGRFRRLLDVPCGIGRHSGPLALLGYDMLGIDRSETALAVARRQYPDVEFRKCDMSDLRPIDASFDGVLCLWQSFGYGDADQNRRVLCELRRMLRPGGRLILDVYNRDAAATLPAHGVEARAGRVVRTKRTWDGRRLRVELQYSDSETTDVHDWQIYSPSEIEELAFDVGLDVVLRCAWFDPDILPGRDHLRMQILLERPE